METVEVLNELIEINNDRAESFEKAAHELETNDMDLQNIFMDSAQESKQFSRELSNKVSALGATPEDGTTASGAMHRAWMEVKAMFNGHDRKGILEECERGEDVIKKAYQDALSTKNNLTADVIALISREQQQIIASHDKIKRLRDSVN
jgi:uncharacterized protein (TIGR02284 family)